MSEEVAREVLKSMRDHRSRWSAPDHGWNIDWYCRRDDGLEAMLNRDATITSAATLRVQGLGRPENHYSQSFELKPVYMKIGGWFSATRALLREMQALHREKHGMEAATALEKLRK